MLETARAKHRCPSSHGESPLAFAWPIAASLVLIALPIALDGCTQQSNPQGYAQSVLDRSLPATDAGRARECNFLGSEMARQQAIEQNVADGALPADAALAFQKAAKNNIAALESRALSVPCPELFSGIASPASGQPQNTNSAR